MAYFGRKPKKPGSVPGAASGGPEQEALGKLSGLGRKVAGGRQARSSRTLRNVRTNRAERKAR